MAHRPTTAVLLIAHGSRHAPANDDLRRMAESLTESARHPIIEPAFLELADPDIAAAGARCVALGATRVLMIPYFLSAGVHLLRDLTAARDALLALNPEVEFRLGPPLGPDPLLEQLVTERIEQLDGDGPGPEFAPSASVAASYPSMGDH